MKYHRTIFFFSRAIVQVVLRPNACRLPWKEHQAPLFTNVQFSNWYLTHEAPAIAADINHEITNTPPLRLNLYRCKGNRNIFLSIAIHHAIFDGNSLNNLLRDVENCYLEQPIASPVPLNRILQDIHAVDMEKARSCYVKHFEGFDWSRSPDKMASTNESKTVAFPFSSLKLADIQALASKAHITPQVLLSSAYALCLCRYYYHCDDIILGVSTSCHVEFELTQVH